MINVYQLCVLIPFIQSSLVTLSLYLLVLPQSSTSLCFSSLPLDSPPLTCMFPITPSTSVPKCDVYHHGQVVDMETQEQAGVSWVKAAQICSENSRTDRMEASILLS